MSKTRLEQFQKSLQPQSAVLLSRPTDIHYLTGFDFLVPEEREAFLLVTQTNATLLHHSFSPLIKQSFCQYLAGINPKLLVQNLKKIAAEQKIDQIQVDQDNLVVSEWELLKQLDIALVPWPKTWLSKQKMAKDQSEIVKLTKAGNISDLAFERLKEKIQVGQTELEVAKLLKRTLEELGSEREAFPTIVAFGANTALPHHQPTSKKLSFNQAILIDFGATFAGYRADMTRSWWFGEQVDPEYEQIRQTVIEAYELGVAALAKAKPQANLIDQAVRTHINSAHYGQYFIHTTGHGVGLEIHEAPSLYLTETTTLPNNCVVTIEPGIYLPDKFGVRYENTLLYQHGQVQSLTGK